MPDPLDAMFQQWGGGYQGTGTPENEILNNIAEETPEEKARRLQLTAAQKQGPVQGPGIGSEKNRGAPDNPVGQLLENAAVGVQDLIDNVLSGNKATPEEIRASRRGQVMEGTKKLDEGVNQRNQNDPILNSEPFRVVSGGIRQAAENTAGFADLVSDTINTAKQPTYNQIFPSLISPLNPKDDIFSNKYEAANFDFGSSQMAQTPIGKIAQGFLGFGITLWATGGLKGDSGLIGAVKAVKSGSGVTEAAKAFGVSGAARGALADLIDNPENGNLSNLIKENAPEWYPTWLTALAVEKGENPWLSRLKTAFEGMGLSEVADSIIGVAKGVRAAKAAKKAGVPAEEALDEGIKAAQESMSATPRATRFVDVATSPQNIPYFTEGSRQVDQFHPNTISSIDKLLSGDADIPNGFAVNPVSGEPVKEGFLVAIDGSARIKGIDPEELDNFLIDEAEALSREDSVIGGYIDEITGEPVIEISRIVLDRAEAIRLGREFDQVSVYDVANNNFINTDGTDQLRLTRNDGFQDVNAKATTKVETPIQQDTPAVATETKQPKPDFEARIVELGPEPTKPEPPKALQEVIGNSNIPSAASRKSNPDRLNVNAEGLYSWVNNPGGEQLVNSLDEAIAIIQAKGRVLDPDAVPTLDMDTARNDKTLGRTTAATEAVAKAYKEFYGIGEETTYKLTVSAEAKAAYDAQLKEYDDYWARRKEIDAEAASYQQGAKETGEVPDTRNSGKFFHGTAREIEKLEEGYYESRNIYGQGFYTTDDLKTAGSYTKKDAKTVKKEGGEAQQNIYQAEETSQVKFYDLDAQVDAKVRAYLEEIDWAESVADALVTADENPNISLAELMDEIRAYSGSRGDSRDTIQEVFEGIRETLMADGYGGFTHVGGKLTGKNKRLHQVRIYWDPANQLSIEKVNPTDAVKPNELPVENVETKRPTAVHRFGDIQRIAAQQAAAGPTATPFTPRGGSDGILTDAAHRLIGATEDGDKLMRDIATSDPDLVELAADTGKSVNQLRAEAQQILADFNGDVEAFPGFNDMDGRKILSDPALIAVKTLLQSTANQISESAYGVLKVEEANMEMLPQVSRMVDQLKSLLRQHKFTSLHYGRGLANFKVPALGIEIPNYFRKPTEADVLKAMKDSDKFLDDLVKKLASGDPKAAEEATRLANALMLADGDPSKIRTFGQWAMVIAGRDGLAIMYNSMLSGPATHIVNTLSNAFNTIYRPASAYMGSFFTENGYIERKAAAAAFASFGETVRESWEVATKVLMNGGEAINDGGKGLVRASESNAQIALLHRAADQSDNASFKAGVGMVDMLHSVATNPLFSYATPFLTSQDEFFKTMVARMEWRSRSMREAIDASSRSMKSVEDEFKHILEENGKKWFTIEGVNKGAIKDDVLLSSSKEATFQTELEGMARGFGQMINAIPPLRIFFPFVKTGHNILAYAYSHLPVIGSKLPEFQKAMSSGDPYQIAVMKGRQAFGSMLIGSAGIAAVTGNLTGNGPSDPEERKLWLQNNKPRSIRIAGTDLWFDYSRLEPFNMILSAVGDVHYGLTSGTLRERDAEYLMGHLMFTISANLTQRSYFAGLVPLGQILTPGYQGLNQLSKIPADTLNNFIPLSGARRTLANSMTAYMREFDSELERILYQATGGLIKGASSPKYSWLTGEPVVSPSSGAGAIWPYRIQARKADKVLDELEDISYESSDIIRRSGVELTPVMQGMVQKAMGESGLKKNLELLFSSKAYKDSKEDAKQQLAEGSRSTKRNFWYYRQIENRIDEARDTAIRKLYATNDDFRREADLTKNDKIRARMAPPPPAPDTSFLDELIQMNN